MRQAVGTHHSDPNLDSIICIVKMFDGHNGNQHKKKTIEGYELPIPWRVGSTDWIPLKDMKASNPFKTVELVVAQEL